MLSRLLMRSKCTKLVGQIKIENLSTARKTRRTERTPRRVPEETPQITPSVVVIGDVLSETSRTLKKRKKIAKITKDSATEDESESSEEVSYVNQSTNASKHSKSNISSSHGKQIELDNQRRNLVTPLLFPQKTPSPTFAEASNRPKAKLTFSKKKFTDEDGDDHRNRPFTLPSGQFKPKQSLGQNFLSDQNYVLKICDAFKDFSPGGANVVEIGPGPGALTRVLYPRYPAMTAIEIDERAVAFLGEKLPGLSVRHMDVLNTDWPGLAAEKGGCLNVIGNLPYYIVSQVLFCLADSHRSVDTAVLTMQLEVAERIMAKPSTKQYGIPSVVFQLYGSPTMNFLIPPTVFYPQPDVESALLTLDFRKPNPELYRVNGDHLRRLLTASFQQRRKMLRQSLKDLLLKEDLVLGPRWATKRPEELSPVDFIQMTVDLFGENPQPERTIIKEPEPVKKEAVHKNIKIEKINKNLPIPTLTTKGKLRNKIKEDEKAAIALINANIQLEKDKEQAILDEKLAIEKAEAHALNEINRKLRDTYVTRPVWRTSLFGISGSRESGKTPEQIEIENSKAEMKKKKKELKMKEMEDNEKFFNDEDDDE